MLLCNRKKKEELRMGDRFEYIENCTYMKIV
jgi:hypothetical protein